MASLSPSPKMQFFTSNGIPLSGGKLYTYAAGTTTPQPTYTDSTGVTPNANPIILDSRGEANVWLTDGLFYAYKLTDSVDALIWTADNIGGLLTPASIHVAASKTTPVDADEIPIADSAASFTLKKLTWANIKTTLASTFAALAGNAAQLFSVADPTSANHAVSAQKVLLRAIVASSATTSDIWAAAGHQIDWTGVATTTAFPTAPYAGAHKRLIAAGACSFTAGANMLINGVASGETITLVANDIIDVESITTTQFRLQINKYQPEFISAQVLQAAPVSLATITANGITSISIPPGKWAISGHIGFNTAATTVVGQLRAALNTSVAVAPDLVAQNVCVYVPSSTLNTAANGTPIFPTGEWQLTTATTVTVYLVAFASFATSTCTAFGVISARRIIQ